MATLSVGHSFHTKHGSLPGRRPSRNPTSVSCHSRDPIGSPDSDEKRKAKQIKPWILGPYAEMEKLGKYLKDNLSPKQKGDWKDLFLMSFSFAVYVYISQQLVCAYFAHFPMIQLLRRQGGETS
ncbi:hypothetical protein H6P81_000975 [Aristolochia fimbriata]|uniref:Uncharacterized protein n=1 Tax=Aristolochia fimbriata TaxID=158543 RepID=A0AAV7F9K8_ARIFI|nr:hypothetical protein H6P81_000975 [Aristolochia fimbriata]